VAFQDAARIDPRSSTARDNVEGIGFQYLDYIVVVALLPLVVVWPLFVAARIGLNRWFSKKPERLRPLAQRLGMRVATSKRQQRKFAKAAERAQKMVSPDFPAGEWSALEHRRFFSFNYDLVAGGLVLGAGLVFLALAFAGSGASSVATLAVVGVFMMGTGAATLWRFSRQRHAA
jgi:hypothetical protein